MSGLYTLLRTEFVRPREMQCMIYSVSKFISCVSRTRDDDCRTLSVTFFFRLTMTNNPLFLSTVVESYCFRNIDIGVVHDRRSDSR